MYALALLAPPCVRALSDMFEGVLTDGDHVAFAESVRTKLMESEALCALAAANGQQQFANSPYLRGELLNAIIATMEGTAA